MLTFLSGGRCTTAELFGYSLCNPSTAPRRQLTNTSQQARRCPAPHMPLSINCLAERRRMIIKRRTPPAAKRKKRRYSDEPHGLDLDPTSPRFSGRITTEVNSANGPLQLARLVQEYGMYFNGTQVTMALSRLAAFVTFLHLSPDQLAAQSRTTRRCVLLLRQRLRDDCDLISYARASYSLGRLGVYDEGLMAEVVEEVYDKLNLFSPDGLAALLAGLAALGHRPPEGWLDRFALEVYTRFSRFNGQELASILYGMARLQYTPSAAWAERCIECFRAALALPSLPPMAPALVKFAFGLASLQIRPSFNWVTAFVARARPVLDALSARELAVLLWALSRMLSAPTGAVVTAGQAAAALAAAGSWAASVAATPAPPPAAAAVAVGLDRGFLDAWFRCSARRMESANAPSLVLVLQALAVLQVTQLPSRYVIALLAQLQAAMPAAGTSGAAAAARAAAAAEELSGAEMVSALLSLVALRIRPGAAWMESCLGGLQSSLPDLAAPILCDLAWALTRLQYQPTPEWTNAFTARCCAIKATLTEQQLSLLAWAFQQLRLTAPDFLAAMVSADGISEAGVASGGSGAATGGAASAVEAGCGVGGGGAGKEPRDPVKGSMSSAGGSGAAVLQSKVAQLLKL